MLLNSHGIYGKDTLYRIQGEKGNWRFNYTSGGVSPRFYFWRFSDRDANRRLNISLSERQMYRVVEVSPRPIDLSRLEAFRGC